MGKSDQGEAGKGILKKLRCVARDPIATNGESSVDYGGQGNMYTNYWQEKAKRQEESAYTQDFMAKGALVRGAQLP